MCLIARGGFLRIMSVLTGPGAMALTRIPSLTELRGHRSGERHQRRLDRPMARWSKVERADRHHVQYRSVLAALQVRQCLLHQEHRAVQIDRIGLRQRFGGHLADRLGKGVGGVVDHHVDAAEFGDGALHDDVEVVEIACVRGHADRLPTELTQMLGYLFAGVGLAAGDHHTRSGEHESLRQCQPDPAGSSRDDDGAVGHVEQSVECCAVHQASRTRSSCPHHRCSSRYLHGPAGKEF